MFLTISCLEKDDIPLPDLDPTTMEGGEIVTYDIGFPIPIVTVGGDAVVGQFAGYDPVEIDLGNDGGWDFRFTSQAFPNILPGTYSASVLRIQFTGEILKGPSFTVPPLLNEDNHVRFLPANALLGGVIEGLWAPALQFVEVVRTGYSEGVAGYAFLSEHVPSGISYLPTRTKVGSDYYYGWLEVVATDFTDTDDDDGILVTRFGISTTPGLRVRMGQE